MRIIMILAVLLAVWSPALAEQENRDEAIHAYFAQADAAKGKPWVIKGGLGFTFRDGNSDIMNLALRFTVEKEWTKHLLRLTAQSIYNEENSVETASEHIFVERYEYKLGEKHRLFQQLYLETDSQESLALRMFLTGGYGYRFVKTENFVMWGDIGGGWQSETYYGQDTDDTGILQLGLEWDWQITKTLHYRQVIQYLPNLSDSGEFRFIWDSKFTMPIAERWAFALVVQDQYNSDPQPGNTENDFTIIFTIDFDFTKKEKKE